jgi:2,3-bisphosphoglycerate-dependent phosphoglycerate mutase
MLLYLIRHAQSQNNAKPEEQRVEDPSLTQLGVQQAAHLAEWMAAQRLTRIITSPFRRTLETAEPLRAATGLRPEVRIALHEQGGCYRGHLPASRIGRPGMTRSEIEQYFPGFDVAADIDGDGWWGGKAYETVEQASRRAARLLEATCAEFARTEHRVAYVMHADVKLLLLSHVHQQPLDVPRNTAVSLLEISPHGSRLIEYNRIDHLPPNLVTS